MKYVHNLHFNPINDLKGQISQKHIIFHLF